MLNQNNTLVFLKNEVEVILAYYNHMIYIKFRKPVGFLNFFIRIVFMYKFVSKRIVKYLIQEKKINNKDIDLYEYCFELLISTTVSLSAILILSLILGEFLSSVIFLGSFILVRLCCGGYHAKSHLTCFFTTMTNYFFFLIALMTLNKNNYNIINISNIFSLVLLILFSPTENEYNPLSPNERRKHKRNSAFVATTICVISFLLNFACQNMFKFVCSASIGLLSATLSMILGRIEYWIKLSKTNKFN